MKEALSQVTESLLCASSRVGREYFELPVVEVERPVYRERVYCYELYHQWRCHWPQGLLFSLCGELDKSAHPRIRGGSKPDFLVHVPGRMENLLIVEVKAANASIDSMLIDLRKLTRFRRELVNEFGQPVNYYAALFWIYGISCNNWPATRERLRLRALDDPRIDLSLIGCMLHRQHGVRAESVDWV